MKKSDKSIRAQILSGYTAITCITLSLVVLTLVCLLNIRRDYMLLSNNRDNQSSTQSAVASHYTWLDALSVSIQTGKSFTGSLDHATCSLGQWMAQVSPQDLADAQIKAALDALVDPHAYIHTTAGQLLDQASQDPLQAYARYSEEIKPRTEQIITGLSAISDRYKAISDKSAVQLERFILLSMIACIVLACIVVTASVILARKLAAKISVPIIAVADWSHKLSLGMEDLDFYVGDTSVGSCKEIDTMVASFKAMANSIQDNVKVIKRVADGDMTAFVSIRSSQDSLGKNLYRMVQSNDLLFAEIVQIAHAVATDSSHISQVSETMAETASVQAQAVTDLSATIDMASHLIADSVDKTRQASNISKGIEEDMHESNTKMTRLVESVQDIRTSSEKISAVIKSIDDIAFQTNILALNAAVEAARAGAAGKGFAVVANEVRVLSLRSAQAAQETKALIEDTIRRTHEGSGISAETSAIFSKTIEDINKIVRLVYDISSSSEQQLEGIERIRSEITHITDAASGYAAVSEESAAASHEMKGNAELLKKAMGGFNLRKRQQGQAYIPPEKRDDPEFVRQANENYRKALSSGNLGKLHV